MEVLSFQQTHLVLLLQLAKRMIYSVNFLFYSSTDYEFMLLNIPSEEMFALTLVVRKKKTMMDPHLRLVIASQLQSK